jgi:2-dehydro-3-deoxy-D-arabinonate dehydratase
MRLTRYLTPDGPAWAADGRRLPARLTLAALLDLRRADLGPFLAALPVGDAADGTMLPPIDPLQEVWAAGVTYRRSRDAREAESQTADVYTRVYHAERPELFYKAAGWRVVGNAAPIRVRRDSAWNVPEPEMVLVINRHGEVVGYTAGNDVSSRDIEGANPLYLPQAKVYDGACALGPGIILAEPHALRDLPVRLDIERAGASAFTGETRTAMMARTPEDLAAYLCRELAFPHGVFLMTGTGIVPPEGFSLQSGDHVRIAIGDLTLENPVA